MHYKNGREAKVGDKVIGKDANGNPIGGTLVECFPEADKCNGMIVPVTILDRYWRVCSLDECLHIDDFASEMKNAEAK